MLISRPLRIGVAVAGAAVPPAWQGYASYHSQLNPSGWSGALQLGALTAAITVPLAAALATSGFGHGFWRGLRLAFGYSAWCLSLMMLPMSIDAIGDGQLTASALFLGCLVGSVPSIVLLVIGALCVDPSMLETPSTPADPVATVRRRGDELQITVKV